MTEKHIYEGDVLLLVQCEKQTDGAGHTIYIPQGEALAHVQTYVTAVNDILHLVHQRCKDFPWMKFYPDELTIGSGPGTTHYVDDGTGVLKLMFAFDGIGRDRGSRAEGTILLDDAVPILYRCVFSCEGMHRSAEAAMTGKGLRLLSTEAVVYPEKHDNKWSISRFGKSKSLTVTAASVIALFLILSAMTGSFAGKSSDLPVISSDSRIETITDCEEDLTAFFADSLPSPTDTEEIGKSVNASSIRDINAEDGISGNGLSDNASDENEQKMISSEEAAVTAAEEGKTTAEISETADERKIEEVPIQTKSENPEQATSLPTFTQPVESESAGSTDTSVGNVLQTPPMTENREEAHTGITLLFLTTPIERGNSAMITVSGQTGERYTITVYYKSGKSSAKGLEEKTCRDGTVSWTWKVGSRTAEGTYRIVISGGGETAEFAFTVTV